MIALNLLPDIKKEYLHSQRIKRFIIFSAVAAAAVCVAVVVLMVIYVGVQRFDLSQTQNIIDQKISELSGKTDLGKIVTVQKQLEVLPGLHERKNAMDRLFGYIESFVPANVSLSKYSLISGASTDETAVEISGFAGGVKSVNRFADTLKNAKFEYKRSGQTDSEDVLAFEDVRVTSYGVDDATTTFKIELKYNVLIFDNTLESFALKIPSITSSPSVTERPGALFEAPAEEEE